MNNVLTGWYQQLRKLLAVGPVRSIGILVGGTSVAHIITALAMPISSRLYTPHDFTVAATFTSLLAIISVVACLRYDMAIPLPEDDVEAANLLTLSAVLCAGVAAAVVLALYFMPTAVWALLGQPKLIPLLWILPISVLIDGLYLALQMWFVRAKRFGEIARSRIAQSALAAGAQIGLGLAGRAPLGLIVGQATNFGAAAIILGGRAMIRDRALLRLVTLDGMRRAAAAHVRFPRYSVVEALANAASIYAPMLIIAAAALGPEAGYLTLAMFLLQAPMAVLGSAVAQVFLSGAPEARRAGRLAEHTRGSVANLIRIALPPLAFLAVASPAAFGLVFGSAWTRSGWLVVWMVPWFLMQFLSSPVSTALIVLGRQRTAMALQLVGLLLRVGMVAAAAGYAPTIIAESYAVSGFVFYALYLAVVLRAVGVGVGALLAPLRVALPLTALAAGLGAVVAAIIMAVE